MILTGNEILNRIESGDIRITPFDSRNLNPNSYDLRLSDELAVYWNRLDMKRQNEIDRIYFGDEGLLLKPGVLYLGRTVEHTTTKNLVPMIEGRSSIGRLGIYIHVTAGFGDIGFSGYWTLEISVVQPVIIYPFVRIAQIYYHEIRGDVSEYKGKYQNNTTLQESMLWRDFE